MGARTSCLPTPYVPFVAQHQGYAATLPVTVLPPCQLLYEHHRAWSAFIVKALEGPWIFDNTVITGII